MPRRVGDEIQELKINDRISGSELVLYYRNPSTKERMGYQNEAIQRKKNKLEFKTFEARQKFGALILTGFREGDFERKVGNEYKPFASDPTSPNYLENWKEVLCAEASDIVQLLAAHVFDMPAETVDADDDAEKN